MSKTERINELLQAELASALNKQAILEDALITISYVECSPDLKVAKIGVSVLPDRLAGTALRKLNAATHLLIASARSRLKLRRLPKFIWEFDASEREAEKIEKLIEEAKNEDEE
ncbi:MAG TPA: ribosome-binding factor A [Patescibacteria group bacterium]|nr:ribosome-binding factor A [Patescibacteria group bacterium]